MGFLPSIKITEMVCNTIGMGYASHYARSLADIRCVARLAPAPRPRGRNRARGREGDACSPKRVGGYRKNSCCCNFKLRQ